MKIPILRIPFSDEDISFITGRIQEILKSGQLAMGKNVKEFEEGFARFCETQYCIGTNSGTSALEIALRCFDVENKIVIVPASTFMSTIFAPVHAGGKITFIDITKEDLSIDPEKLNEKITKDTKVIILVHIGGIISHHLKEIKKICKDNNVLLLEDGAHAHGATIDGKKAGSLGDVGAFSFYPTKIMTSGEGGAITTNSPLVDKWARVWRDEGKEDTRLNIHPVFGNNWRLTEFHAAVAISQLNKINWILSERRKIAHWYDSKLKNVSGISLLKIPEKIQSSYYKYIVFLDEDIERNCVKKELKEKFDVSLTGEVYEFPCYNQPVFKNNPHIKQNKENERFPVADYICKNQICLPLYPGLLEPEVDYVVESLKTVLSAV